MNKADRKKRAVRKVRDMLVWEQGQHVADLAAARMCGFPSRKIDEYRAGGLRERYNQRTPFNEWVHKWETKAPIGPQNPRSIIDASDIPYTWLMWSHRQPWQKVVSHFVKKAAATSKAHSQAIQAHRVYTVRPESV